MPNKTIYVSEEDLRLFERAQELSGANLSSVIVQALRRYIEVAEARQRGLDEITVLVNSEGAHRRKRFLGQRLVRTVEPKGKGTLVTNIYRTAGKRYAVHTRLMTNWEYSWGDPEQVADPSNWGVGTSFLEKILSWGHDWDSFRVSGDYALKVYDTLDELKAQVSNELYLAVTQAMEGPEIEDLDI